MWSYVTSVVFYNINYTYLLPFVYNPHLRGKPFHDVQKPDEKITILDKGNDTTGLLIDKQTKWL